MAQICTLSDIEEIERVLLVERQLPESTYATIRQSALTSPDRPALVFFPDGEHYRESIQVTYSQLLGRIHQVANMLFELGVGPNDVVSLLLPNLPQTHFALWGAEAAEIVNPVNPLLEAGQIAAILRAARTKVLIALGPLPGSDIWEKVVRIRPQVPSLSTVIQVLGTAGPENEWLSFETQLEHYPADRLLSGRSIASDDLAAYFHTGGTTGSPKLARHTHGNEVFDAWAITQVGDTRPEHVVLCGLPLFHVNAVHVTGLAPLSVGASVVLLSPAGYRDPGVIKHFWKSRTLSCHLVQRSPHALFQPAARSHRCRYSFAHNGNLWSRPYASRGVHRLRAAHRREHSGGVWFDGSDLREQHESALWRAACGVHRVALSVPGHESCGPRPAPSLSARLSA